MFSSPVFGLKTLLAEVSAADLHFKSKAHSRRLKARIASP